MSNPARLALALTLALTLALAACASEPAPVDDAAAQPPDAPAQPCGGACGPGTVCELGRCVALNVPPPDAGQLDAPVALDAPEVDVDVSAPVDAAPVDALDAVAEPVDNCDGDRDGFRSVACGGNDCDDNNPAVNPAALDRCNGLDDNCDGVLESAPAFDVLSECRRLGAAVAAAHDAGADAWSRPVTCAIITPGGGAAPPVAHRGDTRFCVGCFRVSGIERCRCFGPAGAWACLGGP